jgi:hypothetical protein
VVSYATPEVVIVHREEPNRDQYGRQTGGGTTRAKVDGAIVAPRTAEEVTEAGRVAVPVGKTVYLPARGLKAALVVLGEPEVDRRDLVEIDSIVYEIDGEPAEWGNPFTDTDWGVEIAAKRVEG